MIYTDPLNIVSRYSSLSNDATIFISYARADWVDRNSLLEILVPLCDRFGKRHVWVDQSNINPGDEWKNEIQSGIGDANIFIVLLSHAYRASTVCMDFELTQIIEKKLLNPESVDLIPIALHRLSLKNFNIQHSLYGEVSFEKFHCLPLGIDNSFGRAKQGLLPISEWTDSRSGWTSVQADLERCLEARAEVTPSKKISRPQSGITAPSKSERQTLLAPYYCDRKKQVQILARHVGSWFETCRCQRPFVVINEGRFDDSPVEWIERLALFEIVDSLPEPLTTRDRIVFGRPKAIEWPMHIEGEEEAHMAVVSGLGHCLGLGRNSTLRKIQDTILASTVPTMLWTEPDFEQEPEQFTAALRALLNILGGWPSLEMQNMMVVSINFVCGTKVPRSTLRAVCDDELSQNSLGVYSASLPRLTMIGQADLNMWANDTRVTPFLAENLNDLRDELGEGLPMDKFARAYSAWRSKSESQGRTGWNRNSR